MKPSDVFLGNDNDSILKDKIDLQDTNDERQSDVKSDDDSSGNEIEEDDNITAKDFAWGMCSRM